MAGPKLTYDPASRASILKLAQSLEGKTLADVVGYAIADRAAPGHKGEFGNLVEKFIFDIVPNSRDEPDILESKVEIKTAPLRDGRRAGIVPKERLVLGMIDYKSIVDERFANSKFLSKNARLLILFYLWVSGASPYDYEFVKSLLHEFSGEDLEIIKRDWERIRAKVLAGLAHEISEGDTLYLGACTKSTDSSVTIKQPNSDIKAKPRAFSLKTSYLKALLSKSANLVPLKVDLRVNDLEITVLNLLNRYKGWSERRLTKELCDGRGSNAKSRYRIIINRMLDVPEDARIEQFVKADLQIKTIRIMKSGNIKESMSFRNIDFFELLKNTEWEGSDFYQDVTKRFLFCIFREGIGGPGYGFDGAFFWTMPVADLEQAHRVWKLTRKRAKAGEYGNLPHSTENSVAHVRTKGRNNKDLTQVPNGRSITKRCFWLNRKYVRNIVESNIKV